MFNGLKRFITTKVTHLHDKLGNVEADISSAKSSIKESIVKLSTLHIDICTLASNIDKIKQLDEVCIEALERAARAKVEAEMDSLKAEVETLKPLKQANEQLKAQLDESVAANKEIFLNFDKAMLLSSEIASGKKLHIELDYQKLAEYINGTIRSRRY